MSNKAKATDMKEDGQPALVPKLRFPEFRDAKGWGTPRLHELCSVITKGATPTSYGYEYVSSGVRFVKIESLTEGTVNLSKTAFIIPECHKAFIRSQLEENDILFSIAGALGLVALVGCNVLPANINQALAVVRLKSGYSHQFLKHYFCSSLIQLEIQRIRAGAAQPNLSLGQLGDFQVLFPSPPEQQKIADCLSSVDELIAAQARKLDALKTHKKGLMQQLFPREGETQPRLRFPEFQDAGEWVVKKLGQIAKYTKGFAFKSQDYKNAGVRIIRVSDLGADFIKPNNEKLYISSESEHEYARYKLTASEIIVTTVGSKPELVDSAVGRGIYVNSNNEGLLNQNLLKLEVLSGVNSRFLFSHINTPEYQRFIASISRGNANQANIAVKDLMGFMIKAPRHAEQQRIADCITTLDDLIAAQTQKLDALKTHKKGLMQQLFPSPETEEA